MKDYPQYFNFRFLRFAAACAALFFTLAHLNSCGIAQEGDDSEAAQRRRYNEKLARQYSAILGLYDGNMRIRAPMPQGPNDPAKDQYRDLPANLLLYVGTVQDGFDRTGAPIFHPRLFAQLKLKGVGELDDTTFLVDYNEVNGQVYFNQPQTNPQTPGGGTQPPGDPQRLPTGTVTSCAVGPRDPQLKLEGFILGGKLNNGAVFGTNGNLGSINMIRVSAGDLQPIRDQRDRLIKAYDSVVGTWEGTAGISTESASKIEDARARIYLYREEVPVGEGVTCPQLRSQFRLVDLVGRLDDTFLYVSYRQGTGELYLTAVAPPANRKVCPIGPQDLRLNVASLITNDMIEGKLQGSAGVQGDVKMKRVSTIAKAPEDQRERLKNAYSKIAGLYAGKFTHSTRAKSFVFQINLDVVDNVVSEYLTCYALKGQYSRPDLVSGAGALVLNADYNPVENRLVLNSTTNSSTGIPGHTYLSISSRLNGDGFTGDMQWWNRVGKMEADKCGPRAVRVSAKGQCL